MTLEPFPYVGTGNVPRSCIVRLLYWRMTTEGPRYRMWYTVSDTWESEEMTRPEAIAEYGEERVMRVDADPEKRLKDWWPNAMERDCSILGHHAEPNNDGTCHWCGDPLTSVVRPLEDEDE